ncbi:unnamed protein product [Ranitomeya imitator]|uniref:RNase H type-1 domain-containing protein n=1 Tax=Ranitomeya imitator TaxID=111125 RepID=A0ABN9MQI2_9NEOB|nr:unnamed protein product [Ranitomeya imitator]
MPSLNELSLVNICKTMSPSPDVLSLTQLLSTSAKGEENEDHISATLVEGVVNSEMAQQDYLSLMRQETSGFDSVTDVPLENYDLILFVDGSRYADQECHFHTGIAVVTEDTVLLAKPLPPSFSPHEAELRALTEAYKMSAQRNATIYSDSRHIHGMCHDYEPIWRVRNFITANGTPIRHHKAEQELMESLLIPERVAVVKVKAHTGVTSREAMGNRRADATAK